MPENQAERGNLDLIIARLPGLGARRRARLCGIFTSEDEFARRSPREICRAAAQEGDRHTAPPSWNVDALRRKAEEDRAYMAARGIRFVSIVEPSYPALLREIYDPPPVLFYRGVLPPPCGAPLLAVVGTRRPQAAALEFCGRVAGGLGAAGVSVVSGLAFGIDAMAHRGNIEGGGKTAAVLGSSVDEVFPAANRNLARRILESGGAILSEYPPGTPPAKWHFPERNRIISGLCPAVLVIAAPRKSGALITADFALEQGRELWVASQGGAFFGEGCAHLAAEGAPVISGADDVLRQWSLAAPPPRKPCGELALAAQLAGELGLSLFEEEPPCA
jgi:DNA processing protein